MSDFMFVMKCFLYTLLISFLMQIKVSGITLEARAEQFLKNSQVTVYLQDASSGGARLLQEGYRSTKNFVMDQAGSFRSSAKSNEIKATRQ
jgi:hypothetical protein